MASAGLNPSRPSKTFPKGIKLTCSSWVPESTVSPLTPEMIEEFNRTITAPKKLVLAWQMARKPPGVFEYMLEKKKSYYRLVDAYKSR